MNSHNYDLAVERLDLLIKYTLPHTLACSLCEVLRSNQLDLYQVSCAHLAYFTAPFHEEYNRGASFADLALVTRQAVESAECLPDPRELLDRPAQVFSLRDFCTRKRRLPCRQRFCLPFVGY